MRGLAMKRILGVVGSPRRDGNTHILVSRMLEGAKKEGGGDRNSVAQ
jgi:multimeric flavodoxin WrbA